MNVFILAVDSLISTFSVVEAGQEITFTYQNKDSSQLFAEVAEEDVILGYFSEPWNRVKCVFEVKHKCAPDTLVLVKTLEVAEGATLDAALARQLEGERLIQIDEEAYEKVVAQFGLGDSGSGVPEESFDYRITAGGGENRIFYGTPGCGKSYHIEHNILGKDPATKAYIGAYSGARIIRTTFHQEYSYTDFVGQILPRVERGKDGASDRVEYSFNPGPFTLALIQAISNPQKKVALVIEEINRGNAPAIFGDIFQLLDRDENSISEYGIVNVSMLDYLNGYSFQSGGVEKRYHFDQIKLPGNLDIYATMNTSDQNVYTLDTAFVRRWEKEKIRNSFKNCGFAGKKVPGMDYTWQEFAESINSWIASHLEELQVNEDKQLGAFFVKEKLLSSGSPERFAYKVFDYLWNDVSKLDHGVLFGPYDTLDSLIEAYVQRGAAVFQPGIFKEKTLDVPHSEAGL